MIRVKGLKKAFGDHLVLKGIDYEIKKGEKIVVVGPSGSGKSTFLRCLNLLEKPTEGEIWFEDQLITDPKVKLEDRKSTRLNSSHNRESRMPSSA